MCKAQTPVRHEKWEKLFALPVRQAPPLRPTKPKGETQPPEPLRPTKESYKPH
jgi:hypothetical protein